MRIKTIAVLFLAAIAPVSGFANDGFGALAAGGVTISKTDTIALKNEVLDISCDKIHVSYDFVNESDQDENALVLFPLPPYPASYAESGVIYHGQPYDFSIEVNGKPVSYDTEVKAIRKGHDITNNLKAAGLTVEQIVNMPFDDSILNDHHELLLPKKQIDTLTEKGFVVKGSPDWDVHVSYVWKQNFPAGSTVHVEHTYKPFIASGTAGGYPGWAKTSDYCLTKKQLNQLETLYSKKENLDNYNEVPGTNLEYILTTANSWKDGVRDFRLIIRTKAEDEIVGICLPAELKKVSATTYEAHIKNFRPTAELPVYFGNAKGCGFGGYGEPPTLRK